MTRNLRAMIERAVEAFFYIATSDNSSVASSTSDIYIHSRKALHSLIAITYPRLKESEIDFIITECICSGMADSIEYLVEAIKNTYVSV